MGNSSLSPALESWSLLLQQRGQLGTNKSMLRLTEAKDAEQERTRQNLTSNVNSMTCIMPQIYKSGVARVSGKHTSAKVSLSLPPKKGPLPSVSARRGSTSFTTPATNASAAASRSASEADLILAKKCGATLLKNASTKKARRARYSALSAGPEAGRR